jgi:hypothetical protein
LYPKKREEQILNKNIILNKRHQLNFSPKVSKYIQPTLGKELLFFVRIGWWCIALDLTSIIFNERVQHIFSISQIFTPKCSLLNVTIKITIR